MSLFDPHLPSFPQSALDKQRLTLLLVKLPTSKASTPVEFKAKFANKLAASLGFTPALAVSSAQSLKGRGWTEEIGSKFRRTPQGTAVLDRYRLYLPDLLSRSPLAPAADTREEAMRMSYLLLQLYLAPGRTLPLAEANKPNARWTTLRLNPATARALRIQLFEEGHLTWEPHGRREKYSVTARGVGQLARLPFLPVQEIKIKGELLEELLRAAHQQSPTGERPETTTTNRAAPVDLRAAILQEFERLKRGEHHRSGVVPIHKVRSAVRERLGANDASHDVFDPEVKKLRAEGKFRLIAITDLSSATRQELDDSIPGFRETLFDMEAVP